MYLPYYSVRDHPRVRGPDYNTTLPRRSSVGLLGCSRRNDTSAEGSYSYIVHLMGRLPRVSGPAFPKSFGSIVVWCLLSGGPPAPRGRLDGASAGFVFPALCLMIKS